MKVCSTRSFPDVVCSNTVPAPMPPYFVVLRVSCRAALPSEQLLRRFPVSRMREGHAGPSVTLRVYSRTVSGAQEKAVTGIGDAIAAAQGRRAAGDNSGLHRP